jgi:hypothetical protein
MKINGVDTAASRDNIQDPVIIIFPICYVIIYCYGVLPFCIFFGIISHPFNETWLFICLFCCFEITRCFFESLFLQNILIKLQHVIKATILKV